MLEYFMQSPYAERIGWVLVHTIWQFALLAFLAVVLQRSLHHRTAATRYGALLAVMSLVTGRRL